MYFSGKVPNSVLSYLTRKNADLEKFYEVIELPVELIKDPTCWLDAKQVETFLQTVDREFSSYSPENSLIVDVGMHCHELRSWGVLDSVLKMMTDPQDIFGQPQRILSYFISPAPPVANVQRSNESVSFDLPLAPEEYPYFSEYLKAAFEGLPQYAAKEPAKVNWAQTRLQISWSKTQASIFGEEEQELNIKPELMRNLLKTLEDAQIELEKSKRKLLIKDQEIDELRRQRAASLGVRVGEAGSEPLRAECLRLIDYLNRAQQLVTLLVKQDRMDRQVAEAMRRVDWNRIIESLPLLRQQLSAPAPTVIKPKPVSSAVPENQLTMEPTHQIDSTPLIN